MTLCPTLLFRTAGPYFRHCESPRQGPKARYVKLMLVILHREMSHGRWNAGVLCVAEGQLSASRTMPFCKF